MPAQCSSQCRSHCGSCHTTESTFNGEIAIHFPGREGWEKPLVLVFPQLLVCLKCGFTEFAIPETELRQLTESDRTEA
jgi:ribosomal protein S27AE